MTNCPLEAWAIVQSVRAAEPTSTERAVLWHHPKVGGCEPKNPGKPFGFPVIPVCWSLELLISPGTGQLRERNGSCFQGKEDISAPRLPAAGEAVIFRL